MLAKTYDAIIQRRSAAGLCWMAIPNTPGSIVPSPFVEDGPPPAPIGGVPNLPPDAKLRKMQQNTD